MNANRNPITRSQYDLLSPRVQGYMSYMQGKWNKDIPDDCPFAALSDEAKQWYIGQQQATLDFQENDD